VYCTYIGRHNFCNIKLDISYYDQCTNNELGRYYYFEKNLQTIHMNSK